MKKIFVFLLLMIVTVSCSSKEKPDSTKSVAKSDLDSLMNLQGNEKLFAIIQTNMGTIELQLFAKEAPKTVRNFVGLATQGFYNGIIFHRVIKNFMIQGGDPTGTGSGGQSIYGGPFADEFSASLQFDKPGLLAMANAGPNTNQSQFFITTVPKPWLNLKHTIFGQVIKGMDVVDAIDSTPTDNMDRPINEVVMEKVTIEKRAN